jgi:serine/threonine protein kinase
MPRFNPRLGYKIGDKFQSQPLYICSNVNAWKPILGVQFILNAILSLIGGDLFERVAAPEYKLTEEKVQIFMRQIIQGLQYIHELNIVHLDIKPYNILFSNKVCKGSLQNKKKSKTLDIVRTGISDWGVRIRSVCPKLGLSYKVA